MSRASTLVMVCLALAAVPAAAGETDAEPAVGVAVGTGGAVAMAPLIAGSVLFATTRDDGLKRTGVFVAMSGLAVAPIVSHAIVHEWRRAGLFAALPVAAIIANAVVFAVDPQVATYGSAETRTTFGVALTAATLGAIVGLADTFGAADRARRRGARF